MLHIHCLQLSTQTFSTSDTLRYSRQPQVLRLPAAADDPISACSCPCRVTCNCKALTLTPALQLWFLSTSGAVCFVLPFLNLYYANVLGFSSAQIGLLGALKPWMAIPFGEHEQ